MIYTFFVICAEDVGCNEYQHRIIYNVLRGNSNHSDFFYLVCFCFSWLLVFSCCLLVLIECCLPLEPNLCLGSYI